MGASFNPNDIGIPNGNYFALPVDCSDADIVILPVPWDVTVSYNGGTSDGPSAILNASVQIDLFDERIPNVWETKIGTAPISKQLIALNRKNRKIAEKVISLLEKGETAPELTKTVNDASTCLNKSVYDCAEQFLREGKMVALVGGDHSTPLGLIKALGAKYDNFGILHLDAHADLREAYEGFTYSHASIMYNVLKEVPQVSRITQVGIRDYCEQENILINNDSRLSLFSDFRMNEAKFSGVNWKSITDEIISTLPDNVYISFDIDSLSPEYCPNTGTPVPGGLSFSEADFLLWSLAKSGKRIIGFDLCEVAPSVSGEWDANVGARILFKLCLYACMTR